VPGLCALILLVVPAAAQSQPDSDLGARLARHVQTMKRDQQVLRFFETHGWLLADPRFEREARRQVSLHRASLASARARADAAKAALRGRTEERRLELVAAATPQQVICDVFGSYCREALAVAHCESRFRTEAQNGQYLGLFQMGSNERRLFGHGSTPDAQARAAHRYFVSSGRDWSPWSCKPWS
jgi:hypothetical protein